MLPAQRLELRHKDRRKNRYAEDANCKWYSGVREG